MVTEYIEVHTGFNDAHPEIAKDVVVIKGTELTIGDIVQVAKHGARVKLTDNIDTLERIVASCNYVIDAVSEGKPIYGVTSGFGGMAHVVISPEEAEELQNNAIWFMKTGAGKHLPVADVRAAMGQPAFLLLTTTVILPSN